MKYKFAKKVQDYSYCCLDELRVDVLETMECIEKECATDAWVHFIISGDNAKKMYELLVTSEYKGAKFHDCPDYTNDIVFVKNKNYVVSINSDSEVIVEEFDPSRTCCFEFVALDKSIPEFARITIRYTNDDDKADYILRFTIE